MFRFLPYFRDQRSAENNMVLSVRDDWRHELIKRGPGNKSCSSRARQESDCRWCQEAIHVDILMTIVCIMTQSMLTKWQTVAVLCGT